MNINPTTFNKCVESYNKNYLGDRTIVLGEVKSETPTIFSASFQLRYLPRYLVNDVESLI